MEALDFTKIWFSLSSRKAPVALQTSPDLTEQCFCFPWRKFKTEVKVRVTETNDLCLMTNGNNVGVSEEAAPLWLNNMLQAQQR